MLGKSSPNGQVLCCSLSDTHGIRNSEIVENWQRVRLKIRERKKSGVEKLERGTFRGVQRPGHRFHLDWPVIGLLEFDIGQLLYRPAQRLLPTGVDQVQVVVAGPTRRYLMEDRSMSDTRRTQSPTMRAASYKELACARPRPASKSARNRGTTDWLIDKLPLVRMTKTRSPGCTNWCILRQVLT
jgi:hypothetical protein